MTDWMTPEQVSPRKNGHRKNLAEFNRTFSGPPAPEDPTPADPKTPSFIFPYFPQAISVERWLLRGDRKRIEVIEVREDGVGLTMLVDRDNKDAYILERP